MPLATNRKVPVKNASHINLEKIKAHTLKIVSHILSQQDGPIKPTFIQRYSQVYQCIDVLVYELSKYMFGSQNLFLTKQGQQAEQKWSSSPLFFPFQCTKTAYENVTTSLIYPCLLLARKIIELEDWRWSQMKALSLRISDLTYFLRFCGQTVKYELVMVANIIFLLF